eukprot:CAMPEP_0197648926 /NCGR_PEP_ID=MMETSP1338-20131121/28042_1 /TAXON_ID=43686 ORGANISM="Pelagodinium beii, Strain RCC1491" /NCGR_SAMPLE_ID=MMETSP1338 /ASSEMBLY_ACC=CAM_ASM_000754 /LENGTH=204 /DNA_ID=CAMNT_0043222995 /DNA_START=50 /DNA_END=664 /DNA_ORIENTATION=+
MTSCRQRRSSTSLLAVAATLLGLGHLTFVGPKAEVALRGSALARRAEVCVGSCLTKNGTWEVCEESEGVAIQGPEEEALAQKCWEAFKEQYESAAGRGMYMDTPVGENDIKYRWRRLRDSFGLTSEEALEIMQVDALPLVIDSNYVQGTFDSMVEGASREKALDIVKRHPGILAAGKEVKNNMLQADVASTVIGATRDIGKMFR